MQRTLKLCLSLSPEVSAVLADTLEQHTSCYNSVCRYGWDAGEGNGVELHKATYYSLREQHPSLPAQLVCAARVKATESLKSARTRLKKGKQASCPQSRFCAIRYDERSYTVRLAEGWATLASVTGRQRVEFSVPPHLQQYAGWRPTSADLCCHQGQWALHVVVEATTPVFVDSGKAVGVDLGVTRPAVTSEAKFLGKRHWREVEARIFRLRRKLQAKGTRSAKRHLRRLSGKLNRFRRDCDHVLSRRIVDSVPEGTTLVFENLTDIRDRVKARKRDGGQRRLHSWSFSQLETFTGYKAEAHACRCVHVDPRGNSRRCPRCGDCHKSNRKSQSEFHCRKCSYRLNADLNAARNAQARFQAGGGIPVPSGLLVSEPIVSSLGTDASPLPLGVGY